MASSSSSTRRYSYEDFFEGFRPAVASTGRESRTSCVTARCGGLRERARSDPERSARSRHRRDQPRQHREDLRRALLPARVPRTRRRARSTRRTSASRFPKNLYVIGTMNTADRSIALVDARSAAGSTSSRSCRTEKPLKDVLRKWLASEGLDGKPAVILDRLNAAIGAQEFSIGHSYFMGARGSDGINLDWVWRFAIKPLLEEHYYGTRRNVDIEFGFDALEGKALEVIEECARLGDRHLRRAMILTLRAWSRLPVRLPAGLAAEVKQSNLVDVRLIAAPDHWELVSDSSVGVVVGSDWELRVEPKIEIPQLLFLVAYAHSQDGWRDIMAGFGRESQLLDAVASGFAVHCERAIERGLLRGYVHYEESRPDLRGRIRFADQIARNPGLPLPLELSYDDFTADVHENRLLRTALEVLLRLPRIPSRARIRLLGVRAALGDVAILRDRRDFAAPPDHAAEQALRGGARAGRADSPPLVRDSEQRRGVVGLLPY